MRTRVIGAAAIGALALSALAVPAAQADDYEGDTKISNDVVHAAQRVFLGSSGSNTFILSFTANDDSGIQ